MAHKSSALFHTDAVQAFGKIPLDFSTSHIDYASFSAHKFYGLKGVGALYCKKGTPFHPLIEGGGQERGRRSGTENLLGITTFGYMAQKSNLIQQKSIEVETLRNWVEQEILRRIPDCKVNGAGAPRVPNTTNICLANVDGETLAIGLDIKGFAVSTGSACSSGSPEPSKTLVAMGLTREQAQSSLRVSLGWFSKKSDLESFVTELEIIVGRIRNLRKRAIEGASISLVTP